MILGSAMAIVFQSTLSMRRATPCTARTHCSQLFQSTLSMRRTTDDDPGQRHGYRISIHALHEESDMLRESEAYGPSSFQSTLSMRRATCGESAVSPHLGISIHALHEESDRQFVGRALHAEQFQSTLSMRRATAAKLYKEIETIFQSTLSMRRATPPSRPPRRTRWISIHALHEESDSRTSRTPSTRTNFNPRSP